MTDSEVDDELAELREQKLEELMQEAGGDSPTDESSGSATAPDEPIHVHGTDEYQELVNEYDVVLVDFHADWCGPCKMIEPVVRELAAETEAAVLKVDIDANQALAGEMGVRGVPTLFVYSGGELAEQVVGVKEKHELEAMIQQAA